MSADKAARGDTETPAERPGTRRRRAKAEAILNSAGQLFAEKGFAETSFGDIAESIDLTPKALYYYYPSKRDLLDAVLDRAFRYFDEDKLAEARRAWTDLSLRDALLASSLEAFVAVLDYGDLLRVSFSETFRGSEETRSRHDRYMTNWTRHVAEILSREPSLSKVKINALADHLVAVLFGTAVDVVLRPWKDVVSRGRPVRAHFEQIIDDLVCV